MLLRWSKSTEPNVGRARERADKTDVWLSAAKASIWLNYIYSHSNSRASIEPACKEIIFEGDSQVCCTNMFSLFSFSSAFSCRNVFGVTCNVALLWKHLRRLLGGWGEGKSTRSCIFHAAETNALLLTSEFLAGCFCFREFNNIECNIEALHHSRIVKTLRVATECKRKWSTLLLYASCIRPQLLHSWCWNVMMSSSDCRLAEYHCVTIH